METKEQGKGTGMGTTNVLVFYEDFEAGSGGHHALSLLPGEFSAEEKTGLKFWKLELTCQPLDSEDSRADAATAHVMILSVRGRSGVPPPLLEWLERWTSQGERLLDPSPAVEEAMNASEGVGDRVLAHIKDAATAVGVEFLYGFSASPVARRKSGHSGHTEESKPSPAFVQDPLSHVTAHQWGGINE